MKERKKIRVFWLSRHPWTQAQREELEKALNCDIQIHHHMGREDDAMGIKLAMSENQCQELVAVLPLQMYQELIKIGIKPIKPITHRDEKVEGEVEFRHSHFSRIERVEIVMRRLS